MITDHIEWLKKFDAAIAKGRGSGETAPDQEAAIAELKALGLTAGDALYYLHRGK